MENARTAKEKGKKDDDRNSDNRVPQGGIIEQVPIEFKPEEDAEP